jgi:hypothetical protein
MLSEQVAINGTNPQENEWFAGYALIQHLGLYLATTRCCSGDARLDCAAVLIGKLLTGLWLNTQRWPEEILNQTVLPIAEQGTSIAWNGAYQVKAQVSRRRVRLC